MRLSDSGPPNRPRRLCQLQCMHCILHASDRLWVTRPTPPSNTCPTLLGVTLSIKYSIYNIIYNATLTWGGARPSTDDAQIGRHAQHRTELERIKRQGDPGRLRGEGAERGILHASERLWVSKLSHENDSNSTYEMNIELI